MSNPPASGGYTKFGFDTEFFEVVGGTPTGAVAARHAEAQRQQGFDDGYARGLEEGQKQAQADLAQLQQHLQHTLAALQAAAARREEELLTQCLSLLSVTLGQLAGHAAAHYGPELLEHHLRALLPLLRTEEGLTLRIHPGARGYHEKLGLPHASILGLPMRIVADSSLGPTDAVVEWQNGGVESKLAAHLEEVARLLAGVGAQPLAAPQVNLAAAASPAAAPVQAAPQGGEGAALSQAEAAARARAAELLGDDEWVDALKTGPDGVK